MSAKLTLEVLNLNNNIKLEEAAKGAGIPIAELTKISSGERKPTIEEAQKLGKFYKMPSELFLYEESTVSHHNLGVGSNSNSGYIQTYHNNTGFKELCGELLELIKPALTTSKNQSK